MPFILVNDWSFRSARWRRMGPRMGFRSKLARHAAVTFSIPCSRVTRLSAIAKQFGSTMQAIQAYNNLPNTDTVYTGMEIKSPVRCTGFGVGTTTGAAFGHPFCREYQPAAVLGFPRGACGIIPGIVARGPASARPRRATTPCSRRFANAKSNVFGWICPYWLGHL